jgi:hypothetical protein
MARRRPKVLAAVTAATIALTAAGCGSGGADVPTSFDPSSGSASGGPANTAAFQRFQSCLAEHGVNLPEGGAPPSGGQPPGGGDLPGGGAKAQRAFQACQQYMPQAPGGAGGGFPGAP